MILFLYGPDNFRSKKKLEEIINQHRLKYKSGLNFAKIESNKDEEWFDQFKKRVETVSMFQENKLIILKNIFLSSKYLQDKFKDYLNEKKIFEKKDIILVVFEEGEIKKTNTLFKFLLKNAFKKQEFKNFTPSKLKIWIQKEVKKHKGEIDDEAISSLITYVGNDLWQIDQEIKKLIAFTNRKTIKKENVDALCKALIDPNIFETIESISKKDKKRALLLISEHLEEGENEIKILSMIVYQFRNLLKLKDLATETKSFLNIYQLQRITGLHPFVIKKTLPIAQKFSIEELKNIYQKLLKLDFQIKTGKIEPRLGIEMFITNL
ncbi:MAG: DNA polymerase III subunit delta [Minisyncoccales bacterium]